MKQSNSEQRGNIAPLILIVLLLAGIWWFRSSINSPFDPEAEPKPVIARGDLAEDERTNIDLFEATSASVVYITSIELRRSLFSLNIYEIPQGTGSGFIWD